MNQFYFNNLQLTVSHTLSTRTFAKFQNSVAPFIGIEANLDEFGEIANWTYSDESGLSYENWESGSLDIEDIIS